jgi:hypothetical protein
MSKTEGEKRGKKEALKQLRAARKQFIEDATQMMKLQRKAIDAVKRFLKDGGKTIPELSAGTGLGTAEAMWYVATLKKYGEIAEGEKDGGYFRYELTVEAPESASVAFGKGLENGSD